MLIGLNEGKRFIQGVPVHSKKRSLVEFCDQSTCFISAVPPYFVLRDAWSRMVGEQLVHMLLGYFQLDLEPFYALIGDLFVEFSLSIDLGSSLDRRGHCS